MCASRVTVPSLSAMKQNGERIACLTCYDASFARLLEDAGVEVLLVGDSLGMVVQGQATTLPVTLEQMVYHTRCVTRTRQRSLVVADLPFLTYTSREQALASAARLMQEGGADMVKLEGGAAVVSAVRAMTDFGIPVCAHLGLLPQSVLRLGGYKVQGRMKGGQSTMDWPSGRQIRPISVQVLAMRSDTESLPSKGVLVAGSRQASSAHM